MGVPAASASSPLDDRGSQSMLSGFDALGTFQPDAVAPAPDELAMAILLRFQTAPKYRLLNSMYFVFRLLDNVLLVTVVVLTIMNHRLTVPTFAQRAVFAAVGLELFYDVMLYTTKYWFLERLSLYVGLGLYVMYFVILMIISAPLYVWWVVGVRFITFVIEEGLDIAIDIEMHNDMIFICDKTVQDADDLRYTDIRRALLDFPHLPTSDFYAGSGSAWLPQSAFADETYSREPFSPWCFRWLYIIPLIACAPFAACLAVFVGIPLGLSVLVDRLWHFRRRVKGTSFWHEMTHF